MQEHINELEKEFEPLHENRHKKDLEELNRPRYYSAISLYVLFTILPSLLLVLLFFPLFQNNTSFFILANPTQSAIEKASYDTNSFLIVNTSVFSNQDPIYEDFLMPVYEIDEYTIYIHSYSSYVTPENFDINENVYTLKQTTLDLILNGTMTNWENGAKITPYVPKDDVAPFYLSSSIYNQDTLIGDDLLLNNAFEQIYSMLMYLGIAVGLIFVLKPSLKTDYTDFRPTLGTETFGKVGVGLLYLFGFSIGANVISQIFNMVLNVPDELSTNQLSINRSLMSPYAFLMIFVAVIIGPVVEELVFRKSFFGVIKNPKTALIVSSLVFGLIHLTTEVLTGDFLLAISNGFAYVAGGLALGYIYMINNKNIYIPIIVHMLYNLIGIGLQFLLPYL